MELHNGRVHGFLQQVALLSKLLGFAIKRGYHKTSTKEKQKALKRVRWHSSSTSQIAAILEGSDAIDGPPEVWMTQRTTLPSHAQSPRVVHS